jgi:hypothetical protein
MEENQVVEAKAEVVNEGGKKEGSFVDALFDVGLAWASHGLRLAKNALEQSGKTLETTAKTLERLAEELGKKDDKKAA